MAMPACHIRSVIEQTDLLRNRCLIVITSIIILGLKKPSNYKFSNEVSYGRTQMKRPAGLVM